MDGVKDPRSIIDRRDLAVRLEQIFAGKADPTAARPALLALFKQALADGRAEVRRRFEADHDGRAAAQGLSLLMDQLIRTLHELASVRSIPCTTPHRRNGCRCSRSAAMAAASSRPFPTSICCSCIPYKLTPHVRAGGRVHALMLWDLGLKVGHATRSVDECLRQAQADMTIRTAILEARYLWGDSELFADAAPPLPQGAASPAAAWPSSRPSSPSATSATRAWAIRATRSSPTSRRARAACAICTTLFWIAKYLYQRRRHCQAGRSAMSSRSARRRASTRPSAFIWTLRCHLHFRRRPGGGAADLRPAAGDRRAASAIPTMPAPAASSG